jgi:hypothetical protein
MVDDLVLDSLYGIDQKLDRLAVGLADLECRVTSIETNVALLFGNFAGHAKLIDRIEFGMDRIQRRLDIVRA